MPPATSAMVCRYRSVRTAPECTGAHSSVMIWHELQMGECSNPWPGVVAQIKALSTHPNICLILDFFRHRHGRFNFQAQHRRIGDAARVAQTLQNRFAPPAQSIKTGQMHLLATATAGIVCEQRPNHATPRLFHTQNLTICLLCCYAWLLTPRVARQMATPCPQPAPPAPAPSQTRPAPCRPHR